MNRRLVDHVSPLIPVRLYGKPDVAIGHAVQLLPNVQAFFPPRLRVELCSLGPIIVGGGHAGARKGIVLHQNATTDYMFLSVWYW
jgi:hypothetical protein